MRALLTALMLISLALSGCNATLGQATRIDSAGGEGYVTGVVYGLPFEVRIMAAVLDVAGADKEATVCPVAYISVLGIVMRGTIPLDEAGIEVDERCYDKFGRLEPPKSPFYDSVYEETPQTHPD